MKIIKNKFLDTSNNWLLFTLLLSIGALTAHLLAEFVFHLYDVTPIDRFTHGLSGMAVTAIILNLDLSRNRKIYFTIGIAASWVAFILWEVFEGIYFYLNPLGIIQTNLQDTLIDLWIDFLGALSTCFLCDELT